MSATTATPSNWNVANGLTAFRIALVPLCALLLLHDDGGSVRWRISAAVAFGGAIITDRIDGELARNWGLVTDLGKLADPIADKTLIGAALVSLSLIGELWWWVTLVILARELGITALRFLVIRHGVMPAGRGGKLKTVAQAFAIMLYIVPLPDGAWPVRALPMAVALALTVGTGLDYIFQAIRLRRTSERTRRKRAAAASAAAGGVASASAASGAPPASGAPVRSVGKPAGSPGPARAPTEGDPPPAARS